MSIDLLLSYESRKKLEKSEQERKELTRLKEKPSSSLIKIQKQIEIIILGEMRASGKYEI